MLKKMLTTVSFPHSLTYNQVQLLNRVCCSLCLPVRVLLIWHQVYFNFKARRHTHIHLPVTFQVMLFLRQMHLLFIFILTWSAALIMVTGLAAVIIMNTVLWKVTFNNLWHTNNITLHQFASVNAWWTLKLAFYAIYDKLTLLKLNIVSRLADVC